MVRTFWGRLAKGDLTFLVGMPSANVVGAGSSFARNRKRICVLLHCIRGWKSSDGHVAFRFLIKTLTGSNHIVPYRKKISVFLI